MESWTQLATVQPLATKMITNSLKRHRVAHAYLIQGQQGTGKRLIAQLFAQSLYCTDPNGVEPCQNCRSCKRITSGNHPDVHWIKPEGQSIKIAQIKHLQKEFSYSGLESNRKIYVIEQAETLTINAANRLLKFLEEPSLETTALLLTNNRQSIIPTIRSRCQQIDLQPLNVKDFQNRLMEKGVTAEFASLISALTNDLQQGIEWSEDPWFAQARKVVLQLIDTSLHNSSLLFIYIHEHWLSHFKDRHQMTLGLDILLHAFKDILYFHIGYTEGLIMFKKDDERLKQAILHFSQDQIQDILQHILRAKRNLQQNVNPTLVMEQLTLRI